MTHEVTEQNRRMITIARAGRININDIAMMLGISDDTLRKYYRHELDSGKTMCDLKVADALMKGIADGDASLIKYYMNNQMGWAEKVDVKQTGDLTAMPLSAFHQLLADFTARRAAIDGQVVSQDGPVLLAAPPAEPE